MLKSSQVNYLNYIFLKHFNVFMQLEPFKL